jgi:hypothetical protein
VHGDPTVLNVSRDSRIVVDVLVAPLNSIRGRVFVDTNGNGSADAGEGVAHVPVLLADRATVTETDGAFTFYNVEPGSYRVRIDPAKLPDSTEPDGAVIMDVVLAADRPAAEVLFKLRRRDRAIVFQELK